MFHSRLAFVLAALVIGCSGVWPELRAADVERSEVVPADYTAAGVARARCDAAPAWGEVSGEPLTSFDCSEAVLEVALAEQAARKGARVLAGVRCQADPDGARVCTGTMAREDEPGPSTRPVRPDPPRSEEASLPFELRRGIDVDVEPARSEYARRSLAASEVGEARGMPVSHRELGSLRTRCEPEDCEFSHLRLALRLAASGLGVSDLVDVSCATLDGERQCLATLAVSEVDPSAHAPAR